MLSRMDGSVPEGAWLSKATTIRTLYGPVYGPVSDSVYGSPKTQERLNRCVGHMETAMSSLLSEANPNPHPNPNPNPNPNPKP